MHIINYIELMPKEIERKFLINKIPKNLTGNKIKQGYLQSEKHRTVRIRTVEKPNNDKKAYLTIKGASNKSGASRYEFETNIPYKEATYLLKLCNKPLIEKTRYIYNKNDVVWEIDDFDGLNKGLLIAEIEIKNEQQSFKLPNFIVKEVTGDPKYYNSALQKHPYQKWKK